VRRPPQGERENSNCDAAKRRDIVVASIIPKESDGTENRLMHGGAGIIAGIIFGACFLAYQYARL
jgi:hypothetical protein